ncbi:hypothetical protein SZ55_4830 [Pseudomonas sp. FeS53a]|nr:hypothetical protein SZ55_4830 [Pseudomonas sp. FeS53a]
MAHRGPHHANQAVGPWGPWPAAGGLWGTVKSLSVPNTRFQYIVRHL